MHQPQHNCYADSLHRYRYLIQNHWSPDPMHAVEVEVEPLAKGYKEDKEAKRRRSKSSYQLHGDRTAAKRSCMGSKELGTSRIRIMRRDAFALHPSSLPSCIPERLLCWKQIICNTRDLKWQDLTVDCSTHPKMLRVYLKCSKSLSTV